MISTMGRWITPGMGEDAVIAKWGLTDDAYDEIILSLPYSTIPGPSDVDNILTIVLKHLALETAVAFAQQQLHSWEDEELAPE